MERLKRKKDEEEKQRLDAAFEQYREDFEEGKLMHINQSFIKGEVVNADKSTDLFKPTAPKKPISVEEAKKLANEVGRRIMMEAQQKKIAAAIQTGTNSTVPVVTKDNVPASRPPKPGSKKDTQKTRMTNMEAFKQELKQMQELRQERRGLREQLKQQYGNDMETIDRLAPSLDNPYLHGNGEFADDLRTTNLYLANLPGNVELQDLYDTFGTFGPLASAKILYPRPDDEHRKVPTLSGFIAYMSRTDAERAMTTMAGAYLRGTHIRVSWARPVALPAVPFFVPMSLRELAMPDPPSGLPFNARPQPSDLRNFLRKYKDLPRFGVPLPTDNTELITDYRKMLKSSIVRVVIPTERPLLVLIHRVIEFLIREGPMFEACVMERERMNPMYRFLFDNNHPTHVYYRWKLYSLLNGEDWKKWRTERYRMFEEGSWWEPPPTELYDGGMPPQLYCRAYKPEKLKRNRLLHHSPKEASVKKKRSRTSSKDEDSEAFRLRGVLPDADREHLEDMLRDLKPEKTAVGDAMVWCLDHADCAREIVQCLFESLDIAETPLYKKIARFYLVNDILGNCGVRVKDVFYYRQFFEDYLERIFVTLNATLESIESRIKAEQFRQRIMLCFRMWEDNAIYARDILIRMQNIFLGLVKPTISAFANSDDEDVDGIPLNANLDDDDEDLDGVPIDINVGASQRRRSPARQQSRVPKHNPEVTASKWNQDTLDNFTSKWDAPETSEPTVPKGHEEQSPDQSQSSKRSDKSERNGSNDLPKLSSAREEERRRLLRDVEMKVVEYQDELEIEGTSNIDKKLTDYRGKLIEKMEKELKEFDEDQIQASALSTKKSSRHDDDRHNSKSKKQHSSRGRRSRSRDRDRSRNRRLSRSRNRSRSPRRRRSRSAERRPRRRSRS